VECVVGMHDVASHMPATATAQFRPPARPAARDPCLDALSVAITVMRRTQSIAARVLVAATLAAAAGCAASEPAAAPEAPSTTGGERPVAQPPGSLGNAPSAQMAVEPRQPGPPVDPNTVSSQPSALVQKPQPAATQGQAQPAAPTYVAAPPPAPRPEAYPTASSASWVWAPGYWYWHGGQYVWIGGAWIPARQGHVYVSSRWTQTGHGWMFVPGGWAMSMYDPIVYPVYPYDPFYYGNYWQRHRHYHGHYGHGAARGNGRSFVRPEGSLGVRRIDRGRGSSRVRVRARQ